MRKTRNRSVVQELRGYFLPRREVSAVYLYGSRAAGARRPWSDVDVAVLLDEAKASEAFKRKLQYGAELSTRLSAEIDVAILNEADPLLRLQVFSRGVEVLARDARRLEAFRQRSLREYWDYVPILRMLDAGTSARLKAY